MICYKLFSRFPFEIKECSIGTGAACGAILLEENFEGLLRTKLGNYAEEILERTRLERAMRHFESSIKRQFNPYDEDYGRDGENGFEVPLKGAPDLPECGLEFGYLKLTRF